MKMTLEKILSLPKSLYVSMRLFPLKDALKLPILCRYNFKCLSLKGQVLMEVPGDVKPFMLRVGYSRESCHDKKGTCYDAGISGII